MGRFLIIDTEKLNLEPEIAKQTINAYLWQHDYLKVEGQGLTVHDMFPVMSEEETEQKFKEVWQSGIDLEYDIFKDALPDYYTHSEKRYESEWERLKKNL